ncbi:MAG TPA: ABC transporter ATP-binding protein [Candidatus Fimimorpha faecalis]|uniref:ABC transporter ATP-binding protein n=1 Tax=Candidatus Fimimorpha faecalis TaxID=2840824 RepID=A0A9D1ED14_9FIRM|nr:ABC transporter ATP-binding protein [Candidatus Fimimorpha faecalis]
MPGPRGKQVIIGKKPKNVKGSILRLLSYIKDDKWLFGIAMICVVVNTGASLLGSYMLRPILNNYIVPENGVGDIAGLAKALMIMGCVYLAGVVAAYFQARIMIGISQRALMKLREELFVKMQKMPVRFFDTTPNGELMSRYTNDVDAVGEMLNNTLIQLFAGMIQIVGTLGFMVYTNIWLTILTLVMTPIMLKAGGFVAGHSQKFYREQQAAIGKLNGYIEETISGQKVIKVFNHEDRAIEDFIELNYDLKEKQMKAQFFGGIMGPVMGNLSQVSYSLTAAIGGILCVMHGFDKGGLLIFVNYSRQFSRPINEISMQVNTIFSALAGIERVFDILDMEEEPEFGTIPKEDQSPTDQLIYKLDHVEGEIVLQNVTFGYNPDKVILKDITLYAKKGQKIAFVGSTGAGKTTVTNLLSRFYEISKGRISIDTIDVRNIAKDELRRNIALVLQDTHLFTGTVMENIRYGRLDATDEEVIAAAKIANADGFIRHLANGYQTMLEGDGSNLSQGQRQLLNIARAALSKAPILILDEATSSVDTRTEQLIQKGMDALMASRTTFVIAHRLSTIRNSKAIIVLEHGQIIERGTHEQLMEKKGRYYQLYTGKAELD